jgi:UDP-glucose 4-epimerase
MANVYGLDKNRSSKKNVLGYVIDRLKCNEEINLYNMGKFKRDFIYVDDVCDIIFQLMNNSKTNEIYNVSSGIAIEFNYPVEYCKRLLDSKSKINYLPNKVYDYYLNVEKIKSLGCFPKTSLEEGLKFLCCN